MADDRAAVAGVALEKRKGFNAFDKSWELVYFCRDHGTEVQCLICGKHTACKKYNIKRHYDTFHASVYGEFQGEERTRKLNSILAQKQNQQVNNKYTTILFETVAALHTAVYVTYLSLPGSEVVSADTVRVSYEVAFQIAAGSRPFTDSDFVKTCLTTAVQILSPHEIRKYEAISLSRNTITRRITDMASDTERQLKNRANSFVAFSLALDESTDVTDIAQLAIFVRGVDDNLNVTEELLDLVPMKGTTTGQDIFDSVMASVMRMGLNWENLESVATDGAPAMTGSRKGLIGRLRANMLELGISKQFAAIHCIVHQEAQSIMSTVVKCTNLIRAHGLNHREFTDFLQSMDAEHHDLPYFCEVRWLSRGKTLIRFFELREFIAEFLECKDKPLPELKDAKWIADLAFLTDITLHLNELNVRLQGKEKLVWNLNDEIRAFKVMLSLWKSQIAKRDFRHFSRLLSLGSPETVHIDTYCEFLTDLIAEFEKRFKDLKSMESTLDLFVTPYTVKVEDIPGKLQHEFIHLTCDTRLKALYKETENLVVFYRNLNPEQYPKIREFAAHM